MASSDQNPENREEELARIADAYFQGRKNGSPASVDALVEVHPHLGNELRESLEAIDLLFDAPNRQFATRFGDFEVLRELGRGGMGIVYLANQISLQRKVALKVLPYAGSRSAFSERFAREAQTVAALQHECIVPIYAAGTVDDSPSGPHVACQYFAMQWIDGDSVAQMIDDRKQAVLSLADARSRAMQIAKWGAQIAQALAYAHRQGVVHRDIKPSNLLVDRQQRIWLTDFGLARHDDDLPTSPSIAYQGTPKYMSPEQASAIAAPVDHRTDIYSLGVTLIEWLTGQSVVGGSTAVESLTRLQHDNIEEPRLLLKGYSRDLVAVLVKCIAREPKDRYQSAEELASDLHACANHQPVAVRSQNAMIHFLRLASDPRKIAYTAIVSVVAIGLMWLGNTAWRSYSNAKMHRVIFESTSGEWLSVSASDASENTIATFAVPSDEVLLPGKEVRLDVMASQRLGYKRTIDPISSDEFNQVKAIYLDEPQKHRWMVDDILWHQRCDILRDGKTSNCCIVLRSDGIALLDTSTGDTLWKYQDEQTRWGQTGRGSPSSFQPDRCVVIHDTNGNECQEIVFAHPRRPELLCLDSANGEQLWRVNLAASAGTAIPNPLLICPVVLQQFNHAAGAELCVVVAPYDPAAPATNRWLMSVDPVQGKVLWRIASQLSLANPKTLLQPSARPHHLQWGSAQRQISEFNQPRYFDDYWMQYPNLTLSNPYENNLRLGTDRPFSLDGDATSSDTVHWHWIDGQDWHKIDSRSGEMVKTWKLPADSVCPPRLLRTMGGRTLVLTADQALKNATEFAAWDGTADEAVWKQMVCSDLWPLPQSFLSRESDFPIVADLDGDGADEWIASSYVPGARWSQPMTPPYGMVMAHRGMDGATLWNEPFHLPTISKKIERGVVVSDQDRDGWKDLLLASRFHGGGVQGGVACFIDLVSGRTGQRIWHSRVRAESNKATLGANELVDLRVLEERRLIAVVTHSGSKAHNMESSRPYSTTFLNLESGEEEAFGLGIKATSFSRDAWLEDRLPSLIGQKNNHPQSYKLVGWDYPALKEESIDQLTLWRTEDCSVSEIADLDRDGFPEVVGHQIKIGFGEFALLDGRTGKKIWSKKVPTQKNAPPRQAFWHELGQDVDKDGLDDLVVFISDADYGSPGLAIDQLQAASVEMVSAANGRAIWQHQVSEPGMVNLLAFFKLESDRLPLLIYQHHRSKKVTCVDLDARRVTWESNSFNAKLQHQAFKTWVYDGKIVWFATSETGEANANFVNAETGETLLQIPIGQRPAVPWSNWIEWNGREVLPILTITECAPVGADSAATYRMDLWLVDRSVKLVGQWSETCVADSPVAAHWFKKSQYDLPLPSVIKTRDGKELLAIPTAIDGTIGCRFLGWDEDKPQSVFIDRTLRLPIERDSTSAFVVTADGDGDRNTDFVTLSDSCIDCTTATGESLWHRPTISDSRLFGSFEKDGLSYVTLQTESQGTGQAFFLDAQTGEPCDAFRDDPAGKALNAENTKHASLILQEYSTATSKGFVASIRRKGTPIPKTGKLSNDPRYVRRLPWVVNAKFFLLTNPVTVHHIAFTRVLKLTFGVFIVPLAVIWLCMRSRFTIRQLLILASTLALVLSLILADMNNFPSDTRQLGYAYALEAAFHLAFCLILFLLPLAELMRAKWRRKLSISLYIAFLVFIPLFTLSTNPVGAIRTTYTHEEFWHLFWFALLPTGFFLLVIHGVRLLLKGLVRIGIGKNFSRLWGKKIAQAIAVQTAGESHAG